MALITFGTPVDSDADIDISALATGDWAVYSDEANPGLVGNRKSTGGSTISAMTGAGGLSAYTGDTRTISWTGGTPTASGSTQSVTYSNNGSTGSVTIVLPAGTATRTGWVAFTHYDGQTIRCTATLSDGSAGPSFTTVAGSTPNGNDSNGVFVFDYAAASNGQTLSVTVSLDASYSGDAIVGAQAAGWALAAPSNPTITGAQTAAGVTQAATGTVPAGARQATAAQTASAVSQTATATQPNLWTPAQLSNNKAWFVADNPANTLTSGELSTIKDKDGTGDATAAGSAQRATLVANGLNGRTVWRSASGKAGQFEVGDLTLSNAASGLTMAIVQKPTTAPGSVDFGVPMMAMNINGAPSARAYLARGSLSTANALFGGGRRSDGDTFTAIQDAVNHSNNWMVSTLVLDYANSDAFLTADGALTSNTSFLTAGNTDATNSQSNQLGHQNGVVQFGDYAEALFIRGALTTTDRQKLEGYLAWQWGLQANLAAGHPYLSAPPTITTGVSGSAAQTAAGVTQAATAKPLVKAAGTQTAAGVTQAATAKPQVKAVAAQAAAGVTQTGTMSSPAKLVGAQTADGVTQTAAAVLMALRLFAATQATADATQTASAAANPALTGVQITDGVTQVAAVQHQTVGYTAAQTTAGVAQAATVTTPAKASAAQTTAGVTQSATAKAVVASPGGVAGAPANVQLRLEFTTGTTDSSQYSRTITNNSVTVSGGLATFASGATLVSSAGAGLDPGAGDFTLRTRVTPTGAVGLQVLAGTRPNSGDNGFLWFLDGVTLRLICWDNGTLVVNLTSVATFTAGVPVDLEVSRSGSTFRQFFNGVLDSATVTYAGTLGSVGAATRAVLGFDPQVGGRNYAGTMDYMDYWVGEALHTASFSPSTADFGAGAANSQTAANVTQAATAALVAAGAVVATASQTTANVTQAATATLPARAAATQTVAGVTQVATATAPANRAATAAQTTADVTQTATARAVPSITGVQTTANVTQAATGTVAALSGFNTSQTTAGVNQVATAAVGNRAAATQTTDGVNQAAAAVILAVRVSSATQTTDSVTQAAAATVRNRAAAAQTLQGVVAVATAAVVDKISAAQATAGVTQTAAATVANTVYLVTGSQTLANVVQIARLQPEYIYDENERTYFVVSESRIYNGIRAEGRQYTPGGENRQLGFNAEDREFTLE